MLFSLIIDAIIASAVAFVIANAILFVFGNLFIEKEKRILSLKEIRKEIESIIGEERE